MPIPHSHQSQATNEWGFSDPNTVRVNAGETLALLLHATRTNRQWLRDFAEESIEVSRDLYEILLHYKRVTETERQAGK